MEKETLTIPNISCDHCVMTIKNELNELDGVNVLDGDAENKTITIEWTTPATIGSIQNTLKEINYPAK